MSFKAIHENKVLAKISEFTVISGLQYSIVISGRLGLGNQESYNTPQAVSFQEAISPCSVHCGVDCSMVMTLDNRLLCCGNNRYSCTQDRKCHSFYLG